MEDFGTSLPVIREPVPGPRSRALAERLARVESRNVTHLSPDFPVFWEEARGANVRDVDGNIYLDLTGAFGVSLGGHGSPAVVRAITDQAQRLIHGMGDVHPPARKVELLEALARILPWPDPRIVLGSSGSEAVEAALKTALLATGRPGILAFEGAYHGLTLGALAATHRLLFRQPFLSRIYAGARFAPFPDAAGGPEASAERCLDEARWILEEGDRGDEVGAVIVEPIQGRAGVRIPPPGFLAGLAELARKAGALLIFDEIFTGLGRTGTQFALQHEGVIPDLLCLGKGLGGGLPLSACAGPATVMEAWPASSGEAIHTSTFLGNPLACAAGLAVLGDLAEGGLVERSRTLGGKVLHQLAESLSPVPEVREVRGRGLFLGIELGKPGSAGSPGSPGSRGSSGFPGLPGSTAPLSGAAVRASELALRQGILVLPAGSHGHVLELSPPLTISEEQVAWVIPRLAQIVREAVEGG